MDDTDAVQHPGRPSPPSIRSAALHRRARYATLECGFKDDRARPRLKHAVDHDRFHSLAAGSAAAHGVAVRECPVAAGPSWRDPPAQVRAWARTLAPDGGIP
jgi:hypothetical protein